MILYFAVAMAVFVYYTKSRNAPWWEMAALALFWPLAFLAYLFNAVTGRTVRSHFGGAGRGQGGRGKGRGRRR